MTDTGEASAAPTRELRCVGSFGTFHGSGAEPAAQTVVEPVRKRQWEASLGGEVAARPYVRARMSGWPAKLLAARESLPRGDDEFLRRVAHDTWRGLAAFTDKDNGLPVDNVRLQRSAIDPPDGRVGDYASTSDVGLYFMSVIAARDLGFISPAEARERAEKVFDTFDELERYQGFFYNFYDTTSLERTSNFISFVDAAWLLAGLVVLRNAVPELADRATRFIDGQDFGIFYDKKLRQIWHGYWVHRKHPSIFHYGIFYSEARLGALLAIGKGDVPAAAWHNMMRVPPPLCGNARPDVTAALVATPSGDRDAVKGYYQWKDVRYVPSWGGSMFEALMPVLLIDEVALDPDGLGRNGLQHARVQQRFATEDLGYRVWGMSPCSTIDTPSYSEFGAAMLGARGYQEGVVTPHAAALALAVTPEEAVRDLRRMAELYDVYGDFGFYDAVDPATGRVVYTYLSLDQAMTLLAIANHLDGGRLRSYFAADPFVAPVLPLVAAERYPLD